MKNRGFTLIELLAVIVILSIISVVSIPLITGYINKTKAETYKANVQTLIEKTTEYVTKTYENNDYPKEGININNIDVGLKKAKFESGIIKRDEKGQIVAVNVYDGEYCANGTKQNLAIEKVSSVEECEGVDGSTPSLKIKVIEVTATKALIVALAQDKESGIKDYKYCIGKECTEYVTENTYEFKGLKAGETYEIEVTARNNKTGVNDQYTEILTQVTEKITITTKIIEEPKFKISSSSYAGEKEVTITYPKKEENYTYGYKIEGTETKEEEVKEEEVTLKITENAKITAYIRYGTEEIKNEIMIVGIDNTGPEVVAIMEPNWTKTKQIEVIVNDKGSGLPNKAYSYNGGTNWTGNNKRTFTENQTVKLIVRDRLGNKTSKYKLCTNQEMTDCKEVEEIEITTIDHTAPKLDIKNVLTSTNNAVINYTITEEQSGFREVTCKYGTEIGKYKDASSVTTTGCILSGLKNNTKYTYKICTEDNIGNSECIEKEVTTGEITNPTITFTNTPTQIVNGYLKEQVAKVTYYSTNITNPTYYVKTTRAGISNINVTEECGTGTNPGECTNITSTKNLGVNKWYKVSGNVNVTYKEENTTNATIYAITYDGVNYSGATNGTLAKIDRTNPTCGTIKVTKGNLGTNNWYTSDITLGVNDGTDELSGHKSTKLNKTTITSNTSVTTITLTTTDNVGNTCTASETYKLDKTKPTCGTINVTGTAGNNSWYKSNVTISKTNGSDGLSGHASTTISHTSITSNTGGTIVTLTTTDKAGNTCSTTKTIKIDKTDPTASFSVSGTAHGSGYRSGAKVTVTCADSVSGYSSGTKTVTLTTAGTNTVSTTCTDKAGRSKSYSQNYIIYVNSAHAACGYATCTNSACGIASTVYKSCAHSECGIASTVYKSCAHSECGIASTVYKSCANSACGIASTVYKSCANSACGVASYNSCRTSGCGCALYGCTLYKKCANSACGCASYSKKYFTSSSACTSSSSCKLKGACHNSYGQTQWWCETSTCATYNSCRTSGCGTEYVTGSSCNNANSKACDTYNYCAHSECGVASYNSCRTSGCGVDYYNYNSCRTSGCGVDYYNYNSCRTSGCGVDYYNYNSCRTSGCGVDYYNYNSCQTAACGYATCWHT